MAASPQGRGHDRIRGTQHDRRTRCQQEFTPVTIANRYH
jgi:hypothetical protein